ncbi:hypothetical protein [Roseibium sp. RKSG952]|uniref:hypothetical protein n=1 Tax=Roseibium sp. RKSG952 TaxID=2529384 RepID=UPI0012BD3B8F|nr:hypothetical protein [Roseibium sp. RKSG952]MTI01537.1 hypothetical protein [Roseibium sp. RKSG952]
MDLPTSFSSTQLRALGVIADIGKTQAEDTAKILEAFAATLPAFLKAANEDEAFVRKVFVLIEAVAKAGDAKKMRRHPLRPDGIDPEVEKLREARKAKPKVKQKPEPNPEA